MTQIKTISKSQCETTKTKIRGNISRMLDFLNKCLGSPENPNYGMDKVYVFEMYATFTHAVEEYGKILYLESLQPNSDGNYEVDYYDKYRDHKTKFDLALGRLPGSIKTVFTAQFDSTNFSEDFAIDNTEPSWDNRLNVLNVDLDDNGDPTNINFHVDIDELRQSVWDFRNFEY